MFNEDHAIEWLQHGYGLQSTVSLSTSKRFDSALEKVTIEISGLTFPASSDNDDVPTYQVILSKLKRVRFTDCTFECDRLELPGVTQWFENCDFSAGWSVTCIGCNHGYTEQGDSLFEDCTFQGSVSIHQPGVDADSLAQYSGLFWECSAKSLMLSSVNLHTRLWYTSAPPWENKQYLDELVIINTNATWPIELSHQTISTIHVDSCTLAGFDCPGVKVDKLSISDTELNGSVNLGTAGVKSLTFMDTTFARPVNCGNAKIGSFVVLRSDFEKVLACGSAAIEDDVCLSSVRYAVAPDFLDLALTEQAKAAGDRETFRLIKHSFEAVANRIEANRFFGLEMEAYRRELKEQEPWYGRERLLVGFNHSVSRHGQSYTRPLVLLLLTAAINAWLVVNNDWQLPEGLVNETVQANILAVGDALNNFAKGFTLARPVMHDNMEFASLGLALLMSTFLWHFLVAVRRFRRG